MTARSLPSDPTEPLYRRLFEALRLRIEAGEPRPGERLPPSRALARDLGVSRNVVVAAYRELCAEGYARAHVGHGTRVSAAPPNLHLEAPRVPRASSDRRAAVPRFSDWARSALDAVAVAGERRRSDEPAGGLSFPLGPLPDDGGAIDAWNRLLRRRLRSGCGRRRAEVSAAALRQALAAHLVRTRGIDADPDRILVLGGVRQVVDCIARALVPAGAEVLVEDPGCWRARAAFEALGARLVACPVDQEGIAVEGAVHAGVGPPGADPPAARLVHVTPSHQLPTGEVMSLARRRALLAWARGAGALIVEDDRDAEFRFDGRPLPAIQAFDREGRVIYVGAVSRTLPPDMRLGYAVLPPALAPPIAALAGLVCEPPPATTQDVLADFIAGGHYSRHLRRVMPAIRARRRTLIDSLDEHFGDAVEVSGEAAGLHVMAWFSEPPPEAEELFLAIAADLGLALRPSTPFRFGPGSRLGLLLGYAGLEEVEIQRAVKRLKMTWRAACHSFAASGAGMGAGSAGPMSRRPEEPIHPPGRRGGGVVRTARASASFIASANR